MRSRSAGYNYIWPNVPAGQNDNIQASGQTITFAATSVRSTIGLLGCAAQTDAGGAQGTLTVAYADTTTQNILMVFTDWTEGGGGYPLVGGDVVAVTTAYRDNGTTPSDDTTYVYALAATLTGSSTVQSITLPSNVTGGSIHLFDIELAP